MIKQKEQKIFSCQPTQPVMFLQGETSRDRQICARLLHQRTIFTHWSMKYFSLLLWELLWVSESVILVAKSTFLWCHSNKNNFFTIRLRETSGMQTLSHSAVHQESFQLSDSSIAVEIKLPQEKCTASLVCSLHGNVFSMETALSILLEAWKITRLNSIFSGTFVVKLDTMFHLKFVFLTVNRTVCLVSPQSDRLHVAPVVSIHVQFPSVWFLNESAGFHGEFKQRTQTMGKKLVNPALGFQGHKQWRKGFRTGIRVHCIVGVLKHKQGAPSSADLCLWPNHQLVSSFFSGLDWTLVFWVATSALSWARWLDCFTFL